MTHALVLAGHGRYEDPWHDTAAIAHRVAQLLADEGIDTTIRGTLPDALDHIEPDLVVVASGRGRPDADFDGTDEDWLPFHARLTALVASGVPVLGLHQATNTFLDSPSWGPLLGGRWIEGTTWHPPLGAATFRVVASGPPCSLAGLAEVTAEDEQYLVAGGVARRAGARRRGPRGDRAPRRLGRPRTGPGRLRRPRARRPLLRLPVARRPVPPRGPLAAEPLTPERRAGQEHTPHEEPGLPQEQPPHERPLGQGLLGDDCARRHEGDRRRLERAVEHEHAGADPAQDQEGSPRQVPTPRLDERQREDAAHDLQHECDSVRGQQRWVAGPSHPLDGAAEGVQANRAAAEPTRG